MRSFISLNIDLQNKKSIQKIQNFLKSRIFKVHNVRFENPENFHLTLFFIGEAEYEVLAKIKDGLNRLLESKFGELSFICTDINAFPNLKNPRVLFLNCLNTENKIFELAEIIKNCLSEFGLKADHHFHPHVTLARVKSKIRIKDLTDIKVDVKFSVSKVSIMQSIISTNGSEHKEIFAINL